jgi:hypothetical protein
MCMPGSVDVPRSRVFGVCPKAEFLPTIVANFGPGAQRRRCKHIQNVAVVENVPLPKTFIMVSSFLSHAHSASLG